MLNLSFIFSILVSRLFICDSILISRFWIIFTIIIRNSLSGRFPLFLCCLVWWPFILFLYLLGLPLSLHPIYIAVFGVDFLYSGSLWSSLYCGGSSLWVGLDGRLVKVSGLGKLVSVFWWVELDFFSMECNEVSSNELWDVSGFGLTLGSLYIEAQGCVPMLLENLYGMSCSGACWPLGGAWFQCRYGGVWWAPVD